MNTEINIAFLCGSYSWGGLEINQLKYALWFKERFYNVLIFCKENSKIEFEAKKNHISVVYLKKHRRYKYFFAGIYLAKLLKKHSISHIICRDSKDLNICSIAKTFSKRKISLSYIMEMQLGVSKKNFLHTSRFLKIDNWICLLPYLKNQVLSLTKFPENRIFILPSAIDVFDIVIDRNSIFKKYKLPNNYFVLGILGRVDPLKGQIEALKAFELLPDKEIALFIVGSPTLNENNDYYILVKKKIEEINSNFSYKKVIYIPHIENIDDILPLFDVSLLCSKSETFGMVTLESLYYGIPVIGTKSGGTPELLKNGKYGLLYTSGNIEELSECILDLYSNNKFDKNELINYAKTFDKNIVLNNFEKILFNHEK